MSPKPYVREIPKTTWFLRHPRYIRYILREITCFFIGGYTLFLVIALRRVAQGPEAFQGLIDALQSPLGILLNLLTLAAAVYHSTSWFNVTPQAMPIQRGEEFVPGKYIVIAHYAVWAVVSLAVLILGV